MSSFIPVPASGQVQLRQPQPLASAGLPIARLLPIHAVEQAVAQEGCSFRERIFTPLITIWIFLGQVTSADSSCRQAVLRFAGWLSVLGRHACSTNTGAYCQARQRLPEGVLARLVRWTNDRLEAESPAAWLWHGLRVLLVDGTTLSMPDTKANQKAYPQSRAQKPGLGFPLVRVCVIFTLAVGTVLDAAFNPYQGKETGETAMLRTLLRSMRRGDLLLGDRYYANYWVIALAKALGIEVLFRQHQLRKVDFRRGRRLSKDDHLITWDKPQRPQWMTKELYDTLPANLSLRESRLRIAKGKCRTKKIVVVTTLVDANVYTRGEILELYRRRWQAELNLRSLKSTMQMDVLRCQSPEMVRKEMWAHFLAYNLIRTAMAQAAAVERCQPWQGSFKAALQALEAWGGFWPTSKAADPDAHYHRFLLVIAEHRVGQRPDRVEPRAVKRRPKPHPLLREPRAKARARLAKGSGR